MSQSLLLDHARVRGGTHVGTGSNRDCSLFNRFQLNHGNLPANRVRKVVCELPKSGRPRGALVSAIRTLEAKFYFSGYAVLEFPHDMQVAV
jgi:hypothetical protein